MFLGLFFGAGWVEELEGIFVPFYSFFCNFYLMSWLEGEGFGRCVFISFSGFGLFLFVEIYYFD